MSFARSATAAKSYSGLAERIGETIGSRHLLGGLDQTTSALVFSCLAYSQEYSYLWVCHNNREAEGIAADLNFFSSGQASVTVIPGFEADPYCGLSPHPSIIEGRATALAKMLRTRTDFVVTTWQSLISRLPDPEQFQSSLRTLETGQTQSLEELIEFLQAAGYSREDPVAEVGEYSRRGGIADLFSPAQPHPVRLELFGDEIESIRHFDPATQRSIELLARCSVEPMRERVVSGQDLKAWHHQAPRHWNEVRFAEALEEKLQFTEHQELFNGFEYLLPLVWENSASVLDYMEIGADRDIRLVLTSPDKIEAKTRDLWEALQTSYQDCHDAGTLALAPERLFFSPEALREDYEHRCPNPYRYHDFLEEGPQRCQFDFLPIPSYRGRIQSLLEDLQQWSEKQHRVLFTTHTEGKSQRLAEILQEYDVTAALATDFSKALEHPISILCGRVSDGFSSEGQGLHLLTEESVFGASQTRAPRQRTSRDRRSVFHSDFKDLKQGDLVVHVEHGIGRFNGLKRIGVGQADREFVELVYRDKAKLFVPIDRLDLLQKYGSSGEASPRLDKLGGTSWERTKKRIRKSLVELAADLIKLYARREVVRGHAFAPDDSLMQEFEAAFEHQETFDQQAAIQAVKEDMESTRPMDRLVCGDVGYGKTEVAMRAAFKAVNDNAQVALLAPTTVLAFQHLNTFRQRFAGFPARVEMLSRFRSRQEQKTVLKETREGRVDVLIGTHRLLSADVGFHNLGLLIVDEEQRFGVAQKEKIKRFKTQVDVLTLSATPIPRTLNMSILGVRDLSIIETPPKDRLAIQTVVVRFSRNIIRSAIDLELKRKGQVFFVHNSVETIYSIAQLVQSVVPDARVGVAHGQLPEHQLQKAMVGFLNREFDVLVCTTIIENGLDIPRANTLIVNQADHFGLSQLYQLRGRVGRSNRRAYAYLLIPSRETLSGVARKRLAAIREFSDLGAGFRIAAHDLEIRGTGNLLGAQQHGHINAVGFELYTKLLQEAVSELQGKESVEDVSTNLELGMDIQIRDHYIPDSHQRLWLYKRVSSLADEDALATLEAELVDRYGKYPRAVANLLDYGHLRILCRKLRIVLIERKEGDLHIHFSQDSPVQAETIVRLMTLRPDLTLSPTGILSVPSPHNLPSEIFGTLYEVLEELSVV